MGGNIQKQNLKKILGQNIHERNAKNRTDSLQIIQSMCQTYGVGSGFDTYLYRDLVTGKVFETRTNVALRNSPVHSNGVINYAIALRLFRTVLLRDHLKNFSRYNSVVRTGISETE